MIVRGKASLLSYRLSILLKANQTQMIHPVIEEITRCIETRSAPDRSAYLDMISARRPKGFARQRMTEGNLAHASAGCAVIEKTQLLGAGWPNIGIITSYNDMLSAHAPFEHYPEIIRKAAREAGAVAQVAGGVPAMCDGVTQGQEGMEPVSYTHLTLPTKRIV